MARQKPPIRRPERKPATEFGRRVRVSEGFRTFALDQLSQTRDLLARKMFGGVGLYAADVFFESLGDVASEVRRSNARAPVRILATLYPDPNRLHRRNTTSPLAVLEDAANWAAGLLMRQRPAVRKAQALSVVEPTRTLRTRTFRTQNLRTREP
jgi:hypothetical protein